MFLWLALAWGSAIASRASAGQPSATAGTCQSPAGAHLLMQCPLQPAGKQQEEAQQQHAHWIIQLASWEVAASHHAALTVAVPGEHTSWHWVQRDNPAAVHPTDFVLLAISSEHFGRVEEALRAVPGVKGVYPDRQFVGHKGWEPEGQLADAMLDMRRLLSVPQGQAEGEKAHGDEGKEHWMVHKRPGRRTTSFMMPQGGGEEGGNLPEAEPHDRQLLSRAQPAHEVERMHEGGNTGGENSEAKPHISNPRRQLLGGRPTITAMLKAPELWKLGYSGKGVHVGVFDTGIRPDHPHIRNICERTNWTHQQSLADGLGHGTFVAGVIGSQDLECPGFAPDVQLHTFKVFTDDQVSFTSWFLDAFNYAIITGVNVINLSIGGPDFLDQPFVEKVWEVTSSGILLISAIGNDGPLYGTLNNPADQSDVIGVGGIDDRSDISSFSSRGMTSWELPLGSGRVKPDIMAFSKDVQGSKMQGGCRSLSGTSVASPVVAGAVCLLASTVPEKNRWSLLNPASMKQALIEGADRLPGVNLYEQGAGRINLVNSMNILKGYKPKASVVPAKLDTTKEAYMWPYSKQPLYAGAMPMIFNATVLNALGVTGHLEAAPVFYAADEGGSLLHITCEWSEVLWPWSGFVALFIRVREAGRQFKGIASGHLNFTVVSPGQVGEQHERTSVVTLPLRFRIEPTPPRSRRVLWDQFHSIKYPPGYIPRDNLDIKQDILDWHGDHLYTNFHGLYDAARVKGYYFEILSSPATCFNASEYGTYLLVDSEEEFYAEEVAKIFADVQSLGLNLVVFGEWYHVPSMVQMRFFDDNTRSWWTPVTGGANVPALNDLLAPFGVALGDAILQGTPTIAGTRVTVSHGADIAKMPAGSFLHMANMQNAVDKQSGSHAVLGIAPTGRGTVAVFGDSNCLDNSHQVSACYNFFLSLLDSMQKGPGSAFMMPDKKQGSAFTKKDFMLPSRRQVLHLFPLQSPPNQGMPGLP